MGKSCESCGGGPFKFCPFSLFLFVTTSAAYGKYMLSSSSVVKKEEKKKDQVVFVLGGPGAGKGTQCELITQRIEGWAHLSAGDLLRAERKKADSKLGELINSKIAAGQIVPSEITVRLLRNAMEEIRSSTGKSKFLIDGFPRSDENATTWNEQMPDSVAVVEMVLFLDCPEDTMTSRLLERGQTSGRNDDNLEVIRKRFETFRKESMPIVEMYQGQNKVKTVKTDRSPEEIYKDIETILSPL